MPATRQTFTRLLGFAAIAAALSACASAAPGTTASTAPATDARAQAFSTWLSPFYGVTPDLMRPDGKTMINGLTPNNPDNQS